MVQVKSDPTHLLIG